MVCLSLFNFCHVDENNDVWHAERSSSTMDSIQSQHISISLSRFILLMVALSFILVVSWWRIYFHNAHWSLALPSVWPHNQKFLACSGMHMLISKIYGMTYPSDGHSCFSDGSGSFTMSYNDGAEVWLPGYAKAAGKILKHDSYSWKTVILYCNYDFNFF